ncbi:MAG: rhomboid family intramembrane serine protease, partial [Verrucomicrobia bacterium]|nr:rhomboid family intramembrane serine protease [Verrucomicrobiota bacterium]
RRWQQTIRGTGLVYDWQCFFWAVLLCAVWLLQSAQGSILKDRGDFNSNLFRAGEWWRAFTATCLHADLEHLGSNLMTGCVFLGLAMASVGAGLALLASAIAGAAANVAGLWFHSGPYHGLGASGVVMASLGILSVQRVYWQGGQEGLRGFALRGFFCALLLLILFGFNPKSDVVVHVAGFCFGALSGLLLQPAVIPSRLRLRLDLPCKLLFAALLSFAWWKAMSPGKAAIGSL